MRGFSGRVGFRQVAAASLAAIALLCLWYINRVPGALNGANVELAVPDARVDAAPIVDSGSDDFDLGDVPRPPPIADSETDTHGAPDAPYELDIHATTSTTATPEAPPQDAPVPTTTTSRTDTTTTPIPSPTPDTSIDVSAPAVPPSAPAPGRRISVLVIWEGGFPFPLLTNFFASFAHNAPLVELVWIGIRPADGGACLDIVPYIPAPPADANIRQVCLSREEYWGMHVDYFCADGRWGCSPEERAEAARVFLERHDKDRNKSLYRIWRGYIFRQYIDPAAEWWGWADVDTFMGSYESMFPWDVAPQFDVLIPAHQSHQLYMRGHLAFIQTRAETEAKMNYYENMATLRNFVDKHGDAWWCAEEAEFSAFVIRDTRVSFLLFPTALAEPDGNRPAGELATFSSYAGTFHTSSLPAPAFPGAPRARARGAVRVTRRYRRARRQAVRGAVRALVPVQVRPDDAVPRAARRRARARAGVRRVLERRRGGVGRAAGRARVAARERDAARERAGPAPAAPAEPPRHARAWRWWRSSMNIHVHKLCATYVCRGGVVHVGRAPWTAGWLRV